MPKNQQDMKRLSKGIISSKAKRPHYFQMAAALQSVKRKDYNVDHEPWSPENQ